jgi:hypothetical protein
MREGHEDARQFACDSAKNQTMRRLMRLRLRMKVEVFLAHLKRILGL